MANVNLRELEHSETDILADIYNQKTEWALALVEPPERPSISFCKIKVFRISANK